MITLATTLLIWILISTNRIVVPVGLMWLIAVFADVVVAAVIFV